MLLPALDLCISGFVQFLSEFQLSVAFFGLEQLFPFLQLLCPDTREWSSYDISSAFTFHQEILAYLYNCLFSMILIDSLCTSLFPTGEEMEKDIKLPMYSLPNWEGEKYNLMRFTTKNSISILHKPTEVHTIRMPIFKVEPQWTNHFKNQAFISLLVRISQLAFDLPCSRSEMDINLDTEASYDHEVLKPQASKYNSHWP